MAVRESNFAPCDSFATEKQDEGNDMANVYTDPLRIVIELDHDETEQLLNAGFTADLGSERQGEVIVGFFGATKGAGQAFDSGVQERRAVCH